MKEVQYEKNNVTEAIGQVSVIGRHMMDKEPVSVTVGR